MAVAIRAEVSAEEWAQVRVAALRAGVSTQEFVGSLLRAALTEGGALGVAQRPERPVSGGSAGSNPAVREVGVPAPSSVSASSPAVVDGVSWGPPEPEEGLPFLPALGRHATKRDFEDPDFDPADYR